MAKYGNILMVFNPDEGTIEVLDSILTNHQVVYTYFKYLYFVETTSKRNTSEVIKSLKEAGIEYFFFHNHLPDGSEVKVNGIDEEFLKKINKILFR